MTKKPLLRQAVDLTGEDFRACAVWVHCHVVDYDEPWYEETDEETFRPWDGPLPVDPSVAIFLLRATIVFKDGSEHSGFLTPAEQGEDLGTMQPSVFVGNQRFAFWGGMPGVTVEHRVAFYRATGRTAEAIFPLRAAADPSLARGEVAVTVRGFCRQGKDGIVVDT